MAGLQGAVTELCENAVAVCRTSARGMVIAMHSTDRRHEHNEVTGQTMVCM